MKGAKCNSFMNRGLFDGPATMKRHWSNNGGFQTLRMLEESSSEVSSSSALGLPPAMVLTPESLASPEYGGLDLWGYDDSITYSTAQTLLSSGCTPPQPKPHALPSMPLPMPPTTPKSENESISSGQFLIGIVDVNKTRYVIVLAATRARCR